MKIYWVRNEDLAEQPVIPLIGGDYGINICNAEVRRLEPKLFTDQRAAIEKIVAAAVQAVQDKVFA